MVPANVDVSTQGARDGLGFVPLWKRIEATLRGWIMSGKYGPGVQLPPDRQIAELLGANRLTVRRALSSLQQNGLLRIEHGVGTFVEERVRYNLGERVRFNQNLRASNVVPSRRVLSTAIVNATEKLADRLSIKLDAPVIRFNLIGFADEKPVSIGSKFVAHDRFPTIVDVFKEKQSFTASFKHFGINDYRRKYTEIIGRPPTASEARALKQAKASAVLAFESLDIDLNGRPVSFQEGCYSGDRVLLIIDGEEPSRR